MISDHQSKLDKQSNQHNLTINSDISTYHIRIIFGTFVLISYANIIIILLKNKDAYQTTPNLYQKLQLFI